RILGPEGAIIYFVREFLKQNTAEHVRSFCAILCEEAQSYKAHMKGKLRGIKPEFDKQMESLRNTWLLWFLKHAILKDPGQTQLIHELYSLVPSKLQLSHPISYFGRLFERYEPRVLECFINNSETLLKAGGREKFAVLCEAFTSDCWF
ncbi:uncharacterized protein NEMAJ01_2131, partial [Nematocida major]